MSDLTTPPTAPDGAPAQWHMRWAFGELTVQSLGGMLAPVVFRLPDGGQISPFHVAPWGQDNDPALPGVLRKLRGDWPCIPFGASKAPAGLPDGWGTLSAGDHWDHGYPANHAWHLVEQNAAFITVAIDYPAGDAIARLERTIRPSPLGPEIEVLLTVFSRRPTRQPIALHPTFVVPTTGVHIAAAKSAQVFSYPVPTEPGVSRLIPSGMGTGLDRMPSHDGTQSFLQLPLPFQTEELMQMVGCQPPFTLHYVAEDIRVDLDWDTAALPDALIWISNGGRSHAPWNGRHYALGIEPVSGFYDLGRVVAPDASHPLAHEKGVALHPETPWSVSYTLSAHR